MRKTLQFLLILIIFPVYLSAQNPVNNPYTELVDFTGNFAEGYSEDSGLSSFNYHSFRSELSSSMITRCTDGKMLIQWNTSVVKEEVPAGGLRFIWVAALDLTDEKHEFLLTVNDRYKFRIISAGKFLRGELSGQGG